MNVSTHKANRMGSISAITGAFFAACLIAVILAGPAGAQNPHGKSFDHWQVRCNTPTGAPSDCQMVQNVVVKESGKPVLQLVVGYMEKVDNPVGVLVLPLGIYLPSGLTMQIDKGQAYEMAFEICGRNGCRVRFSFDEALLGTFKKGNAAEVVFYSGGRKPIRVPLSLKGFTAALKTLR